MKKARLILSASLLALAGFTLTFSSCTKDEESCPVGKEGKKCDTEVRTKYYNTYRGNGTMTEGDTTFTFSNWGLKFSEPTGSDFTKLHANLIDDNDASQLAFDVTLSTNTTFNVVAFTSNDGYSYTGNGTINETSASLSLTETHSGNTVVYEFPTMTK